MKIQAPQEIICDVVHPNVGVEARYYAALMRLIVPMGTDVQAELTHDWARSYNPVGFATDAPNIVPLVQKTLDRLAERWTKRADSMAHRIADKFASEAWTATDNGVRASFAKAGFTIKFRPTRLMQMAYSVRISENIDLIRSIPQKYLTDVKTQVWNAVTTGSDLNQLTLAIEKIYGVTTQRAALIARDQNNKAKAAFEQSRRTELGIEEAIWTHSSAGKEPRPTHVKAGREHVRFKISEGWLDPAVNKRIWPGTEITCRCLSRAVIPGISAARRNRQQA